ncbi:hypothetical protein [Methanobacterium spitsbergense]|uniref:Uncharacterized protein n=1 Tax=Methanobacterium spitsbergense TaxID=2874285 RepID=A0A8T5UYI9_9EURY|nr:hypothetical protein [Methanobacterium spitsbergense]MBZ2166996.1 hypothetical protein [Methanobacterium spitsbergense]
MKTQTKKDPYHICVHEDDFTELFKRSDIKQDSLGRIERTLETKDAKNGIIKEGQDKEFDKLEQRTETLYGMVAETRSDVAEIKGFIQGQDKREAVETREHDADIKQEEIENADKRWHLDRLDKWLIAVLTMIVAVCSIIAGLSVW